MLIDYLEQVAKELAASEEKLLHLGREYQLMRDQETREQLSLVKKEIKQTRFSILEYIYLHLQELVLLQKHYPLYISSLKEDPYLGEVLRRISWLLDFKSMGQEECKNELLRIKAARKQLYEARDFLKKWAGSIDKKSLVATWPILSELLVNTMDKDEVIAVIKRKNKELRKAGWLVILHEPFIEAVVMRFLQRIRELKRESLEKQAELKKSDKGIYKKEVFVKELEKATKEHMQLERRLRHLLLASYLYLLKLKKQKNTWKDKKSDLASILEKLPIAELNEKIWLTEMQKRFKDL